MMKNLRLFWLFFSFSSFFFAQDLKEYRFKDIRKFQDKVIVKSTKEELKGGTYKFIGFDPSNGWLSTKKLNGYVICSLNSNQQLDDKYYRYTYQDKLLVECTYSNGILKGKYNTYDSKGNILTDLFYKKGKATGKFFEYDGSRYDIEYHLKNDVKDGALIKYYVGEVKEKGYYKNDELDGEYFIYHVGGGLKEQHERKKGFKVGQSKKYFKNGALQMVSITTNPKNFESTIIGGDHQSRRYEHYFREGGKYFEELYQDGVLIEEKKWWPNGSVRYHKKYVPVHLQYREYVDTVERQVDYETYEPQSTTKEFYDNGQLKELIEYDNGIQNGWVRRYFKNGSLKEEYEAKYNVKNGLYKKYSSNGILIEESQLKMGLLMFNKLYDSIRNIKNPYYEFQRQENGDYLARGIQRKIDSLSFQEKYFESKKELFHKSYNKKGTLIKQFQKRGDTLFGSIFSFLRPLPNEIELARKDFFSNNTSTSPFLKDSTVYSNKGKLISNSIYYVDDSSKLAKNSEEGIIIKKEYTHFLDDNRKVTKKIKYYLGTHEQLVFYYDENEKAHGKCLYKPYGLDYVFEFDCKHGKIEEVIKKDKNSGSVKILFTSKGDDFFDTINHEYKNSVFSLILINSQADIKRKIFSQEIIK
ncbi:MAG: hypothetical protein WBG90_13365 [Saonia sp.]